MSTKTWIARDVIGQLLLLGLSITAWFCHWTGVMFLSLGLTLLWQLCSAVLWSAWHHYSFRKPWIWRAVVAVALLGLAFFPYLLFLIGLSFLEAVIYFALSIRDSITVFRMHRSFWDFS